MTRTADLLAAIKSDDMAEFERLTEGEPRVRITASRSDRIESVCTWAYAELSEPRAYAWELLCRLAREGLARWVTVVLRQEQRLIESGYEW